MDWSCEESRGAGFGRFVESGELLGGELVFTSVGAILVLINTRDFHLSNSD